MKNLSNYLSIFRILFSPIIITLDPFSMKFLILYLLLGLSDVLDGYIARKTNTVSKIGDNLDSIGDFIMIFAVLIMLLKKAYIPNIIIIWTTIITLLKIISVTIVLKKYKTFEMLHTYMNKITGSLLFILPITFIFKISNIFMIIICISGSLAAIEELAINLTSNKLDIDRKSIFKLK